MTNSLKTFHETLDAAVTEGIRYIRENDDIRFDESELREPFTYDGIPYGGFKESHCAIDSLNGRSTKKYIHLQVWRSSTGRYEVNAYVL